MLKQAFMGVAALTAIGVSADNAWAQCVCCSVVVATNATSIDSTGVPITAIMVPTPSYQQFSCSPSTATHPTMQSSTAPSVVLAAPQVQSYRRYSYPPNASSGSSGARKHPYEYSKADPRRYRP